MSASSAEAEAGLEQLAEALVALLADWWNSHRARDEAASGSDKPEAAEGTKRDGRNTAHPVLSG